MYGNYNASSKICFLPSQQALHIITIYGSFLFLLPRSWKESKRNNNIMIKKKKDKKEIKKHKKSTLESFSSKGYASLWFEVFGFYHSVCHSISQKSKMARHVVSSCQKHPKLLFQTTEPRGSPFCNTLVTLWRSPAHPSTPGSYSTHPFHISSSPTSTR